MEPRSDRIHGKTEAGTRARAGRAVPDRRGTPEADRRRNGAGLSVVKDRQVELAEALGVGEDVDCRDLSVRDREAEYGTRLSVWRPHRAGDTIHERRLRGSGTPREMGGHGHGAADLL